MLSNEKTIFVNENNEEQINKAAFIIESPLSKLSELYHSEVKNLAILMS